jgi:GNAT superfamily N-acetyltransferase
VRETERVYGQGALPFSVHTRAHVDGELEAELETRGFHEIAVTPGMTLHAGARAQVDSPDGLVMRSVADDDDRAAYADVMAEAYAVYGTPEESTQAFFARMESVRGPTTHAYLGWFEDRAVSGATLYLSHGIGGIGWVGTRPSAFGRGYGTALTWRVVQEGFRLGVPWLNLQASPMGVAVYRRLGFETPTQYRMFIRVA